VERGWLGSREEYPGAQALGKKREAQLQTAAKVPGMHQVDFLNYLDGELDQASPAEVSSKIVGHLQCAKPDVVVTFGPDGGYGHPDHTAISRLTAAALVAADTATPFCWELSAQRVSKFNLVNGGWTAEGAMFEGLRF